VLVFVSLVFVLRFFKLIRGPEEDSVAAHAGEKAQEGGMFHCDRCGNRVRVNKGQSIPKCPNCGNGSYDSRTEETSG
jgi:predicted RNA-binding Zn-ribbon protein involved in translation (DUF1610 family)